jgi:Inner membrane protein YgaP-like, transmembrane domain/Putative zinc-finger
MNANEGTIDRVLRAVAGVTVLLGAFAIGSGSVTFVLFLVVGVILLVTAAVGFCPLYRMLGISTRPAAKQRIRRGRMVLVTQLADAAAAQIRTGVPMRCWEARSQVSDYLDGELGAEGARLLESHLAGCRTCPPLYASLVATRTAISAEPDPDSVVPPELAARIAGLLD